MLAKVLSYGLVGINGYPLQVEVDVNPGLPGYEVVGLADTAIKESKERVKAAIKNSGFSFPINRIIINLAPADTKKEGSLYDLPISVGIMVAMETITPEFIKDYILLGEVSLDGSTRKVNGILPMLISAKQKGYKKFIVPYDNINEASFINDIEIYAIKSLKELVSAARGEIVLQPSPIKKFEEVKNEYISHHDFCYVKGQTSAKRALEIAAAGGHNVLMIGPPGAGKTMLAKCFPGILPDLTFDEALEVTKIHSVAGILDSDTGIIVQRPFRSPHHTSTIIALTGGGRNAKPGEISLAHNGVLFLDEMPEYDRKTIETLRQPMEDGIITIARNVQTITYPASFNLIASMNPCPCGYYGSNKVQCKCASSAIYKYLTKISGPLLDRIDLHVEVDSVNYEELTGELLEECSADIKKRVDAARKLQLARFKGVKTFSNSKMSEKHFKKYCVLSKESASLIENAFSVLNLTARAYNRILKVARTIADLENCAEILPVHIAEAIQYRSLDKKYMV